MNGEEYKKLSFDKKVEYVNTQLQKGRKLSEVFTDELHPHKAGTFSGYLTKRGYKKNDEGIYILEKANKPPIEPVDATKNINDGTINNSNTNTENNSNSRSNSINNSKNNSINNINTKNNSNNNNNTISNSHSNTSSKSNAKTKNNTNINEFTNEEIESIRELLTIKDRLMELSKGTIKHHEPHKKKYDDIKPKTVFVSDKIFNEFKTFCKDNDMQMKDILSVALDEYIKNNSIN